MKCRELLNLHAKILTGLLLLTTTIPTRAQIPDPDMPSLIPESGTLGGNCNFITGRFDASCIQIYIQYLIRLIFMFIGAFFLIMIVIAGYQIAIGSATGEKEGGKNRLKWAIIGFIICALSFFIIDFFIGALARGTQ